MTIDTPPRADWSRFFVVTLGIGFSQNVVLAVARFAVPMILLGLGSGAAATGAVVALLTAIPLAGMIAWGRWIDRVGPALPSRMACSALFIGAAAVLAAPGYGTLAFAALLIGAGANFGHVAIASSVGRPDDLRLRARNLGLAVAANSLAQFAGPALAGVGFDWMGARGALLVALGFAVLGLVLLASGTHLLRNEQPSAQPPVTGLRVRDLLGMRDLRVWLLANGLFGGAVTLFPFVGTLYGASLNFPATATGTLVGMLALGAFASRLLNTQILRLIAPQRLVVLILFLAAAGYAVIPLVQDWTALAAISVALGMTLGLGMPNTLALIYHTAPESRRTEAASVALWFQNLLQLLAPLVAGLATAAGGIGLAFWLVGALLLTAAILIRRAS